jgi:hypothetical protein
MAFDIEGARKAGYTDAEIAEHLAKSRKLDTAGARTAGYTDAEILAHLTMPAGPAAKPPRSTGQTALDATNAVATGYNRGLLQLAGLPVDTVANVIDLGKAAAGTLYGSVTGKPVPDALTLGDRSNVVGSSQWLLKQAQGATPSVVDASNPEYQGGYLQRAGSGLTAVMNPKTRVEMANQAVLGLAGATGSKAAYDATGSDAAAVLASLAPGGAQQAAVAGTKLAMRGGEKGRQAMAQRVQDFRNAGVEQPTVGLATGNRFIEGLENILQSTPGAVGVMRRARENIVGGLEGKAAVAADAASTNRGVMEAGTAIQRGLRGFKDDFKGRASSLYDRLDGVIDPQFSTPVGATRNRLAELNADIPGAPAVSQFFKNEKLQALEAALRSDTAGSPASVMVYPQPPKAAGGLMNAPIPQSPVLVEVPQGPSRNTLPFEAVKKTRTMVGNEIADHSLVSDVPRSKWNPLYGALTEDMRGAAVANGPAAEAAFNRANAYNRAGLERLERVAPFADKTAPEQAFTALERAGRENVSTLQAVKKSLPEGARGTVAATVIERLGKAKPGAQNDQGDAWSPETFLSNWNRMTPKARAELFSGFPNSARVRADVDAVARSASMMRDGSRMWANPSGTAANLGARATLGAGAAGALISPWVPVAAGGFMAGNNALARILTSKETVNALARPDITNPRLTQSQVNLLAATGLLGE